MTAFPATTTADFKGKKIRSFGFFGSIVQMMGGQPVSLPTEDQYLALQQGTVDGTIFPYLAMQTMNLKEVAKQIPLDKMLVETDSPYLAPTPYRGKSNQPAFVKYVAEHIADLRGTSLAAITEATTENFVCSKMQTDSTVCHSTVSGCA